MQLRRFAVFGALATISLAGLMLPVSAQSYRGKFTLPFAVRWGSADLPAGEYTVATGQVGSAAVIWVSGKGITATIMPGPINLREATDAGAKIEVTDVNGTQVVTRFIASSAGKDYSFLIPKAIAKNGSGAVALKKAAIPVSN